MSTREENPPVVEAADVRELRLAVVLYGGVSLAIYMHGTTKELHRLVKASTLEELRLDSEETPSETFWRQFLRALAERDEKKVRTRVVVDIVAGTSAGGINGIYLAKALARNETQDALRDLWLDHGDIAQLLRGPSWLPAKLKAPWLLAATMRKPPLRGRLDRAVDVPGAPGHGRAGPAAARARDAHALAPPPRAVRDDDGLQRLRPRPDAGRPEADPRPRAPARADVPLGRRRRRLPPAGQRGARVLRPRDLVLPRRVPAGQLRRVRGLPREGRRRHLGARAEVLQDLRALECGAAQHVLRRRRHPRQPAVRPRDRGDQAPTGRGRDAAEAPLPRARSRRTRSEADRRRGAAAGRHGARRGVRHPAQGAAASTTSRRSSA